MEPFYPLRALRLRRVLPRPARGVRVAGRTSSPTTPTSRRTRSSWLEHSERYVEAMVERFGLGARQPRRRDRLQRRLPAPVLQGARHPGARDRAGRERRRRSPCRRGIPTLVEFFGVETARSAGAESSADLLIGNNVLAHVPDLNDFVGGMKVAAQAGRRDHDGVPAPDAADRRERSGTRSTTSTSRTSRSPPRGACSRRTGCACSTSRSCRPTAARCGSTAATTTTPRKPMTERAAGAARARGAARATRALDDLPRLRRARSREDKREHPRRR